MTRLRAGRTAGGQRGTGLRRSPHPAPETLSLKKTLKAKFDESKWEHLTGTELEPIAMGDERRIVVKVIDEHGNELMVVREPDA